MKYAHISASPEAGGYISESERTKQWSAYDEIAKMLTGLIRHLEREDRSQRG